MSRRRDGEHSDLTPEGGGGGQAPGGHGQHFLGTRAGDVMSASEHQITSRRIKEGFITHFINMFVPIKTSNNSY